MLAQPEVYDLLDTEAAELAAQNSHGFFNDALKLLAEARHLLEAGKAEYRPVTYTRSDERGCPGLVTPFDPKYEHILYSPMSANAPGRLRSGGIGGWPSWIIVRAR